MNIEIYKLFTFPFILYWLFGLGITYFLGDKYVERYLGKIDNDVSEKVTGLGIHENIDRMWKGVSDFKLLGGELIGRIERVIFFFGILIGSWVLIGAWLTFKVASKWDSWSNITKVPMMDEGDPDAFGFVLRRYWGTLVYQRSMVGTGLNLLYAGIGVFTAYGLGKIVSLICQNIK